ncbi:MAG: winged helix-turn-helix domain-containing protein [Acidobacteriota bacterium]
MKNQKNISYSFDPYLVEVAQRRVWREKELVSITPKAFDTLIVLLENKGKIVEKEVLLNEVWKDTFVEESTLAQNISTLRKMLGTTNNNNQFIETVSRHGYRFVADVKEIVGDEEIIVVERHVRTQISAEHEKYSDEIIVKPEVKPESAAQTSTLSKLFTVVIKRNKLRFAALTTIFCLGLAAIGIGAFYFLKSKLLVSTQFKQVEVSKLTSNGNISLVSVSPDGKYLALVEKREENYALMLRQIDNSTTIEIVPPKNQQFVGVTFSADAKQIYYVTYKKEDNQSNMIGNLYKISTLGGQVQQILEDIDSPITISPDKRQFAFVRNYLDEKQSALIISSFDNKDEKKLTTRKIREFFLPNGLSWSPDGKMIAATANKDGTEADLITVNTANGEQNSLTSEKWQWLGYPNWLADGSGIIVAAFSGSSNNQTDEIWQISYPDGAARKIGGDISGIFGLGFTSDSKSIVAVKSDRFSSFWTSSNGDFKHANRITQGLNDYNITAPGISWTPDGKIIYGATLNANLDIWMMDADGSHKRQITTDGAADSMPVVSADGQDIFFISNRSGQRNLWRMKTDGSEQKQLTDETGVFSPSLAENGRYVIYTSIDNSTLQPFLHKIPVDGGQSVQLTKLSTVLPKVSPDGKLIACYYPKISTNEEFNKNLRLTILSAEDGTLIKQFPGVLQNSLFPVVWSDNTTLNYLTREGVGSKIWRQSLDQNSPPKLFFDSPAETIFRFAFSTDGQNVVYEKGMAINDIVLVKSVED